MIKIHTSPELTEIHFLRGILAENGIQAVIEHEYTSMSRGGIICTDTWPALWVAEDDAVRAKSLLEQRNDAAPAGASWICAYCGEESDAQFNSCWNCSHDRSA
jgi:hypothetical protein